VTSALGVAAISANAVIVTSLERARLAARQRVVPADAERVAVDHGLERQPEALAAVGIGDRI
jgi:hypothetical protein